MPWLRTCVASIASYVQKIRNHTSSPPGRENRILSLPITVSISVLASILKLRGGGDYDGVVVDLVALNIHFIYLTLTLVTM